MTDELDPTQRRAPFSDPVTGDQTLPDQPPARQPGADVAATQAANAGTVPGLPGELFAKPNPDDDQPVEGRRDQPVTPPDQSESGREADADSATLGH